MNYEIKEISFPSSNGTDTVRGKIYIPKDKEPRGIVQLSHGMVDHVGRYEALAEYLTGKGYIFAGNDHIGHGMTAASDEDLGFFAKSCGVDLLLSDLYTMNKLLFDTYGIKPVLMGHSMGSFLSRLYTSRYPDSITAHIIHGTGGPMPILPLGKALVNIIIAFRGARHRSALVKKMAFMGYNSKFPKSEGAEAWLTRDLDRVANRSSDRLTSFTFTVSAYRDLFFAVGESNSKKWFEEYPKDMKTLILSGDMDPVGNYGKGPSYVFRALLDAGCRDVRLKLYEGARHELFNELCREEAFSDIADWLESIYK